VVSGQIGTRMRLTREAGADPAELRNVSGDQVLPTLPLRRCSSASAALVALIGLGTFGTAAAPTRRWWSKCLTRAEIAHRPMHEARHTAITDFLRRTGNLKLAQMLAGHADIGTTANIYAHLDTTDLETALQALNEGKT
jgi:integrase